MAKKLPMVMLAVLATVFLCGNVVATPTWSDVVDPADVKINTFQSHLYTHDLSDNGFDPGADLVSSYALEIALYDDHDRGCELAFINLPGIISDGFYTFSSTSETFGWSLSGRAMLNTTGLLSVQIFSILGDFYFASSKLEAYGCETNPTSVPEGNAMIVLGAGLFGLGGCARRMFKS